MIELEFIDRAALVVRNQQIPFELRDDIDRTTPHTLRFVVQPTRNQICLGSRFATLEPWKKDNFIAGFARTIPGAMQCHSRSIAVRKRNFRSGQKRKTKRSRMSLDPFVDSRKGTLRELGPIS